MLGGRGAHLFCFCLTVLGEEMHLYISLIQHELYEKVLEALLGWRDHLCYDQNIFIEQVYGVKIISP